MRNELVSHVLRRVLVACIFGVQVAAENIVEYVKKGDYNTVANLWEQGVIA